MKCDGEIRPTTRGDGRRSPYVYELSHHRFDTVRKPATPVARRAPHTVITTLPRARPTATYLTASSASTSGLVRSITGVTLPAPTHLLTHPQTLAVVGSLAAIPPDLDEEIKAAKVQFWQGRFDAGAVIVERAISRGELAKCVEPRQVLELVVGPAYLRALLTGFVLDDAFVDTTVARVIDAFRSPQAQAGPGG